MRTIALLTATLTFLPLPALANYLIIESGSITLRLANGNTQAAWIGLTLRPGQLLIPAPNAIAYYTCTNGNRQYFSVSSGLAQLCGSSGGNDFDPRGDLANSNIFLALLNDYFIPNSTIANPDAPPIDLLSSNHPPNDTLQLDPLKPDDQDDLAAQLDEIAAANLSDTARAIETVDALTRYGLALDALNYIDCHFDAARRPPLITRWLGDLYIQLGRYSEAIAHYETILASTDADHEHLHAEIGLAHATAALDQLSDADHWLDAARDSAITLGDDDLLDIIEQWQTKIELYLSTAQP